MGQSSELEELLRAELAEGTTDSSGHFTISRDKALEKLAAFRLPSESAWVLKIVQAAVASGCQELDIRQTSYATEFHFKGDTGWTLDEVENEFYQVETSSKTDLEHLKQGLWCVSLNGMRPFTLVLPDSQESLLWTGDRMQRKSGSPMEDAVLTVSHRTMVQGRGIPFLAGAEAAGRNAEIAQELARHAFTCSIPLRVDGRRLDALQVCRVHGLGSASYPIQIGFVRGDLPQLGVPPATLGGFQRPTDANALMEKLFQPQSNLPGEVSLMCLLTAHLHQVKEGKKQVWKLLEQENLIYWVRDGVVVDRTRTPIKGGAFSMGIFASAEGLQADVTGFALQKTPALRMRVREIVRLVAPFVVRSELFGEKIIESARDVRRLWAGVMTVAGLGLLMLAVPSGLMLAFGGLVMSQHGGAEEKQVLDQLQQALSQFKTEWRDRSQELPAEPA